MGNESIISNVDAAQRGKVNKQRQNETTQVVQRDLTILFNIHQTPQISTQQKVLSVQNGDNNIKFTWGLPNDVTTNINNISRLP
jgi:hypothetical protein